MCFRYHWAIASLALLLPTPLSKLISYNCKFLPVNMQKNRKSLAISVHGMSFIFLFASNLRAAKLCLFYEPKEISVELQLLKLNLWKPRHHILGWKKREVSHSSEVSAFPWSGFQVQTATVLFLLSSQSALNVLTCVMLRDFYKQFWSLPLLQAL